MKKVTALLLCLVSVCVATESLLGRSEVKGPAPSNFGGVMQTKQASFKKVDELSKSEEVQSEKLVDQGKKINELEERLLKEESRAAKKGERGAPGLNGKDGVGSKGERGAPGPAGRVGGKGAKGDRGPAGGVGNTGKQGRPGRAGGKGAKGDRGPAGGVGAKGAKGDRGPAGSAGGKGAKGDRGTAGGVGAKGAKGDRGAAGVQGAQGPQGQVNQQAADYMTMHNLKKKKFSKVMWQWEGGKDLVLRSLGGGRKGARWHITGMNICCNRGFPGGSVGF